MLIQMVNGIVGGLAYSLSGLANKKSREKYDWTKMVPTLIIAGIVGGVAGYTGQDFGMVINGSVAAGVTVIVEKLYKAIKSKVFKK